ncbi:hypothetical protein LEMLEM_LOCUS24968 [Lemmus lemmus]
MSWDGLRLTLRLALVASTRSVVLSVVLAKQGSLMSSTMHPITSWFAPRPWSRTALCLLTARRTDRGMSPTMHCPWATRRGPKNSEEI